MSDDPASETEPSRRRLSYETLPPEKRPRAALTLAAVLMVSLFGWLSWALPLSATESSVDQPSVLFVTADGKPLSRQNFTKAEPVKVDALPPHLVGAFLAIEDRRFWSHPGVDPRGVGRALLSNLRRGRVVAGGSTITQQLAKNAFLGPERSLRRKAQEALIAVWLEIRLGKQEILSRYLSNIYLGDGVFGLRAASRHYFGKEPEKLTLAESAVLAGMVKAPSTLNPRVNPKGARARAKLVLAAMVETGAATPQAASRARFPTVRTRERAPAGSYFVDWIQDEAEGVNDARYGQVTVRTTLDSRLQRSAERIVRNRLAGEGARLHAGQAAVVALRCDGAVMALVGGRDYRRSQFNRATQAKRQPGSAFKLFVYLAALRDGARPGDRVTDAPIQVADWSPGNYGGRYGGEMTLTRAFAQSSNAVAVQLSEKAGRKDVIRAARDLGVRSPMQPDPTIALGTAEVDLMELTAAYAGVRAGHKVQPYGLDGGARRGWIGGLNPTREQEPMLDLLNAVVEHGSGRVARFGRTAYGKTGTTQDHRDALFVGFAGDLTVGVWVGNDDRTPMRGVKGGGLPASIWRDVMKAADRAGLLDGGGCPPLPTPAEAPEEPRTRPAASAPRYVQADSAVISGPSPSLDPAYGYEVAGPEAYAPPAYVEPGPYQPYYEPEGLPAPADAPPRPSEPTPPVLIDPGRPSPPREQAGGDPVRREGVAD